MVKKAHMFLLASLIIPLFIIGCSPELSVPNNPKVPKYVEDLSVKINVDRFLDFDSIEVEDRLMNLSDDMITYTTKTYSNTTSAKVMY